MTERQFETIIIRPNWRYYTLNMGWLVIFSLMLLFVGGMEGIDYHTPWLVASGVVGVFALYQVIYLRNVIFAVTGEQLVIHRGVFIRTCDYLELYRIIDFKEHQNLLDQFLGLKNVFIYSTDRTNPQLRIFGVVDRDDIVCLIRERVIYNRSIRNIHEFSNLI